MKHLKLLTAVVIISLTTLSLYAQENVAEAISLVKVAENVFQLNGGRGSNGGVIVGDNAVLVIDAKMDESSVNETLEAIKEISDKPVKYLVNTHSDGDHIMGNRYFPSSVTFIAHENCREDFFQVNFGRASDWDEPEYYPFTPSITFSKQMDIWLGKTKVELHYFGVGHTAGDIIVYSPSEKIAFVGDLYFQGRPQLIHSAKEGNSFEYVRTIRKMLESLDAEIFLSGHSEPVGRKDFEVHIQEMVDRQKKVEYLIQDVKNQEEVLTEFTESEKRLVTSIYQELSPEPE